MRGPCALVGEFKSACRLSLGLILVAFFALLAATVQSQPAGELAILRGVIRDPQGKPLAEATIQLQSKDSTKTLTAQTHSQGSYSFAKLPAGVYTLRAELAGYDAASISALFLGAKETKNVDLTLAPAKASSSPTASAPAFFDQPKFTVAGVTDTTSLGGHGSDTVVRTREVLAKETASLSKTAGAKTTSTESEKTLREKVDHDPGDFQANHQLGEMLLESGKAREAIPYLEHAALINSGDYANSYDLALANADSGNYDRARDNANTLLLHHETAGLHHLLGDVQEKLGNSLEAVREYQRAAEMEPGEAHLFDWGSELLLHHAPEPALEVFAQGNRSQLRSGCSSALAPPGSHEVRMIRQSRKSARHRI